jgi:hypothetical protein
VRLAATWRSAGGPAAPKRPGEGGMGHRMTQINTDEQNELWACFKKSDSVTLSVFICVNLWPLPFTIGLYQIPEFFHTSRCERFSKSQVPASKRLTNFEGGFVKYVFGLLGFPNRVLRENGMDTFLAESAVNVVG